jgi:hypothetical protein
MDFMNVNMDTGYFSWIISADISMLLKIYGYEYEYAGFLSMESPTFGMPCTATSTPLSLQLYTGVYTG